MSEKETADAINSAVTVLVLLTLSTLKLTGYFNVSWWVVFIPLWFPVAFAIVLVLILGVLRLFKVI